MLQFSAQGGYWPTVALNAGVRKVNWPDAYLGPEEPGDPGQNTCSSKTQWIPAVGDMTAQEAHRDISHYLMHRCNWIRPPFNDGLAPAQSEKKLNIVSGIS